MQPHPALPRSTTGRLLPVTLLLVIALAAACGRKGDLYLPGEEAPATTVPAPAAEAEAAH